MLIEASARADRRRQLHSSTLQHHQLRRARAATDSVTDPATQPHPPGVVAANGRDVNDPVQGSSEALRPRTPP